ncbi:MAG: NAD(P)/FAD-dependent oxidoreductase [Candidatus Helarchaeota archaeon]|nr:NAD(P)/FAD-dependent oxidoreductase [Candidatus Helarchaeota archaeon]
MRVVILGGNIAGSNAGDVIKKESPETEVEIYTEEQYYSYTRIKLPAFICGRCKEHELTTCDHEWYSVRNIKFNRNFRATKILPEKKIIHFNNGKETTYDKLLLAIGSKSNILPIPGIDKEGVFTLKTLDDAKHIIDDAKDNKSAIVIGGGLLGLETAKGLADLNLDVKVCEYFPRLLPRQLDTEGAEILQQILEDFNIKVILNANTKEIIGDKELTIKLADGRKSNADMIIFSVGVKPNIQLAKEAGIKVDRGIIVNEYMMTNIEDIYAAGDCAEFNGRVWGIVPVAYEQSKIAALNIIGKKVEYEEIIPSNTLKIVGIDLTSMGKVTPELLKDSSSDEIRFIDREKRIYKKIVIQDNKVVGAILLGDRTNQLTIKKMIKSKLSVSKFKDEILKDDFNLEKYLGS